MPGFDIMRIYYILYVYIFKGQHKNISIIDNVKNKNKTFIY